MLKSCKTSNDKLALDNLSGNCSVGSIYDLFAATMVEYNSLCFAVNWSRK